MTGTRWSLVLSVKQLPKPPLLFGIPQKRSWRHFLKFAPILDDTGRTKLLSEPKATEVSESHDHPWYIRTPGKLWQAFGERLASFRF